MLDIWYGTGLLLADLAQCVGPDGSATGLDPSADVLGTATGTAPGKQMSNAEPSA